MKVNSLPTVNNYMNVDDLDLEYSPGSSRKQNVKKRNPVNIINEQCFDKKTKIR